MNNRVTAMWCATRESPSRGQAVAVNGRRSLLILLVLLLALGPLLGANRQALALFEPDRLAGENRYETAVKIGELFTSLFQRTVYLSRSDQFADALAAGSLSDGPMLLIPSCNTIPAVVAEAIERWNPDRVVALGGEKAVCESSLLALANGRPTDRISGADRIHTAVEISKRSYADEMPQEIYLATAKDSPDALAMAVSRSGPILLVGQQDPPPQALLNEIARFSSAKVVVVGGKAALPDSLIQTLVGSRSYERLSGENRYETAVRISQYLFPGSVTASNPPRDVYLARGDIYVDAVAAAMGWGSPLLLVPSCGPVPAVVRAEVQRLQPENVVAIGGESAICSQVLQDLTSDRGAGGHGLDAPRRVPVWSSASLPGHDLVIEIVNSDEIYFVAGHPNSCEVLGIGPGDECEPQLEEPVWRYTEEISVDGGSTICWVWRSESDWNKPEFEWEVMYLGPRSRGLFRGVFSDRNWRNPCWGQFPNLPGPSSFSVRLTFSNLVTNEVDVSPWITLDLTSL